MRPTFNGRFPKRRNPTCSIFPEISTAKTHGSPLLESAYAKKKKFANPEELRAQIARDIASARRFSSPAYADFAPSEKRVGFPRATLSPM